VLTGDKQNGLKDYELSKEQWALAKELEGVLEVRSSEALSHLQQHSLVKQIFDQLTELFSQAEVPLIYQVLPMLEQLEHQLEFMQDDWNTHNVIRIAAQAALLMVGKYYALTDDNEVYRIAMGNC
jgi:hypothetical protein